MGIMRWPKNNIDSQHNHSSLLQNSFGLKWMLQTDGKTLNIEKTSIYNALYLVEITMQVAKPYQFLAYII